MDQGIEEVPHEEDADFRCRRFGKETDRECVGYDENGEDGGERDDGDSVDDEC